MCVAESSVSNPKRILVFGGTFDPPHLAHAVLPAKAAAQLICDLLLYVPVAINPLKVKGPIASAQDRLAMLLLAIADVPAARISTIEIDRAASGNGPSYTIDTLRALHREYTNGGENVQPNFHLLIGSDQALDFHRWKDWQEILALATPAVMLRPPFNDLTFRNALREKYDKPETELWMGRVLRLPAMDINATSVRRTLARGEFDKLTSDLDPKVIEYILANRLYC